jgi:hypothetical protein
MIDSVRPSYPGSASAESLIARAEKYLNTGSGEYASEIMRDMAEFIRRLPSPAQTEKVPIKESDLARFFLGIVVSERKGIGDVFDSAKDFLAKYEVTVRGSQVSSTGGGAAA